MSLAAAALTVAGLAVLLVGTAKAAPFVFFGTAEERAELDTGRALMLVATLVLVVAAALLALRGNLVRAVLVASPGVVATALVSAFPKSAYAWLAFVVLAPAALAAAVTAARG